LTQNLTPWNRLHVLPEEQFTALGIHTPGIPIPGELQKRTGASKDEHPLSMMRETAEMHTQSRGAICPLWMALMNV
jgi:hypothetical protein